MADMHAPASPFGPSPSRRPASLRRTSAIDTSWPMGRGEPMVMLGRARDLFTPLAGPARVLNEDSFEILASPKREILAIKTSRCDAEAQQLVGARGGGALRRELPRALPEEHKNGTPLHLILDDFSGASLVANWAWSRWPADLSAIQRQEAQQVGPGSPGRNGKMEGVCAGFRPGSAALNFDGSHRPNTQSSARVSPLPRSDDPQGWHELNGQEGVGMRRARRLDVWVDEMIHIDVGFQDSATSPDGVDRIAVHEYHVSASANLDTFELLTITATPTVLPYAECLGAVPNVTRLVGTDLHEFRLAVLEHLPGVEGCTHLNDVLRSIADVPQLIRRLKAERTSQNST